MDTPHATNTKVDGTINIDRTKNKIKSPLRRRLDYVISIIVNAVLLYVANHLLGWEAQFLKHEWTQVLPAVNLMLGLTLGINVLFLLYDGRGFYFISRTITDAIGVYATLRVWRVFPFDFQGFFGFGWLNPVMKIVLPLAALGLAIAIIVRAARFMMNKNIYY